MIAAVTLMMMVRISPPSSLFFPPFLVEECLYLSPPLYFIFFSVYPSLPLCLHHFLSLPLSLSLSLSLSLTHSLTHSLPPFFPSSLLHPLPSLPPSLPPSLLHPLTPSLPSFTPSLYITHTFSPLLFTSLFL